MSETETPPTTFTAHDRCDQCGAQALHRATKERVPDTLGELVDGKRAFAELLFCGHHQRRNFAKLVEEGWVFG